MGDWDYINDHMGGHDSDGLPNFMSEPGFSDDCELRAQSRLVQKIENTTKKDASVNWSSEASTEAVFKHYKDDGHTLEIYIDRQDKPIKCTSSHTGDYQLAVEYVKNLNPEEQITYWSRGVNVYSPKEWFYKVERTTDEIPF